MCRGGLKVEAVPARREDMDVESGGGDEEDEADGDPEHGHPVNAVDHGVAFGTDAAAVVLGGADDVADLEWGGVVRCGEMW